MRKILFGITSLTLGGAERVLVDLANKLAEQYDVTIFTIYAKGELKNQLSDKVKLKSMYNVAYNDLTYFQKHFLNPLKLLLLKKLLYKQYVKQNYDVEIAFLEGPITRLFSVPNNKTRKIVWVHNDISKVFGNGIKSIMKKMIDKNIYSKYKDIIFVSNDNLIKFNKIYPTIQSNKQIIYNYIDKDIILNKAKKQIDIEMNKDEINFVTVARLVKQKAIERLIEVHDKLIKEGFKHKFYIVGDGPLKLSLEAQIERLHLNDTFVLLGQRENPYPYIINSDYFCLLSYYEGLPIVLLEAKILNKFILATDTASREALNDYTNKIIIDNTEDAIYEELKKIIINHNKDITCDKKSVYNNNQILIDVIDLIEQK